MVLWNTFLSFNNRFFLLSISFFFFFLFFHSLSDFNFAAFYYSSLSHCLYFLKLQRARSDYCFGIWPGNWNLTWMIIDRLITNQIKLRFPGQILDRYLNLTEGNWYSNILIFTFYQIPLNTLQYLLFLIWINKWDTYITVEM